MSFFFIGGWPGALKYIVGEECAFSSKMHAYLINTDQVFLYLVGIKLLRVTGVQLLGIQEEKGEKEEEKECVGGMT